MQIKMSFVKKPIWRRTTFWNAKCHYYNAKMLKVSIGKPHSDIQFESESVKRSVI